MEAIFYVIIKKILFSIQQFQSYVLSYKINLFNFIQIYGGNLNDNKLITLFLNLKLT